MDWNPDLRARKQSLEEERKVADKTPIEWTSTILPDGTVTKGSSWNPSTGCDYVSPGCKNCYANPLSLRLKAMGAPKYRNGFKFTAHEDALNIPLHWKKPRKIFVNSMSDLFHEEMPAPFLDAVFKVMREADWHIYQILTKRPNTMANYVRSYVAKNNLTRLPDHIWCGTSVEMCLYKWRIDTLRTVPCKIKFLSLEPLLGSLGKLDLGGISWVISGGESGVNHRPAKLDWFREIRDQCMKQKVPFFLKQLGGRYPGGKAELDGREWRQWPGGDF